MTTSAVTIKTTAAIRQEFIDYFAKDHGHAVVPSSPVVPHDDPTLLFTNAGMNQFKDVFLGTGTRDYSRAVDTQKCIRAGGKHNDLEDVGKDSYHHTFFEMLGNWSFGDYFKAEAIEWAWKLLTEVWGLDADRLYPTIFKGDASDDLGADEEAFDIWAQFVPADRITRFGKKDNFWEMGETGPCGPCSEIHYDATPDGSGKALVNMDDPRVIEIWNLVFIQFNRAKGGALATLPAKHVDTGMGLERIARVMQGKTSNYDTDVWQPIFESIRERTDAPTYGGSFESATDTAYRVLADHIRCLTVALTDGARPGNEGRGYVLRRILRRAVRIARQTLNVEKPLMCELVPSVVESLGEAFPELSTHAGDVSRVIEDEEVAFLRTLDRGLELFDDAAKAARNNTISAEDAFKLHDTYGFPIDLTRQMAEERVMAVDEEGYEELMADARRRSRSGGVDDDSITLPPDAIGRLQHLNVHATNDAPKYLGRATTGTIKAIWNGHDFDATTTVGKKLGIVVTRTNFYAESGGQVGDRGEMRFSARDSSRQDSRFQIEQTQRFGDFVLHIGSVSNGELRVDDEVELHLDRDHRRPTQANHTATHLLNFALREVLGEGVDQKGSLVASDRLRFDFSHGKGLTSEELSQIEALVNQHIAASHAVHTGEVSLDIAMTISGVRAVFGERYPDPVRVVSIGPSIHDLTCDPTAPQWAQHSIEFCGGTHLASTADAKHFVILSEQALAAGVRRIIALTGDSAAAAQHEGESLLARCHHAATFDDAKLSDEFDALVKDVDGATLPAVLAGRLSEAIETLRERVKQVRKSAHAGARQQVVLQAQDIASRASGEIIVEPLEGADKETLLNAMDAIRSKHADAGILLASADVENQKVLICATVSKSLIGRGLRAGDWVKHAAAACGGGGGGRPDMAQAGGKDPARLPNALNTAREFAQKTLA